MNTSAIVCDQVMQEIIAIPPDKTLSPVMPMDIYIEEALNLYQWAKIDKAELLKSGLSEELLEDLPFRADAASEAQTIWRNFVRGQSEAQQRWNTESLEAYELRDELLHTMRIVYRDNVSVCDQIMKMTELGADNDLIEDLDNLAAIGRAHPAPLRDMCFDLTKLEQAAVMSRGMNILKATATDSDNLVKRVRDQAYTHLKEAVDAVRDCGCFVFWQNPSRRKGYESEYVRRSRRRGEEITRPFASSSSAANE